MSRKYFEVKYDMNDKESNNINNLSISSIFIPAILGIAGSEIFGLNKVFNQITTMSNNFERNVNLLKNIKPYFSHSEQYTLSKIQDIFDVLNKVGRIKGEQYETEVQDMCTEVSISEKKQKIIQEFYNYLDVDKRQFIDKAMEVKDQIFTAKNRINGLGDLDEVTMDNKMDVVFEFIKCFKPILSEEHSRNLDKFEKAVQVLKAPD
ncbi:hypothetical protein [Abyssisolibacter fermentans]|uniref:hypothetical protein n=1 Tax=Abyssisolibacter fermentans TaxID=1766203 RepID=UPI00138F469B|nr:hypothetical protein [Abyssisolibacter fermentans]